MEASHDDTADLFQQKTYLNESNFQHLSSWNPCRKQQSRNTKRFFQPSTKLEAFWIVYLMAFVQIVMVWVL